MTEEKRIKIKDKEKITIMTIGDHPLAPSGVGTQTKYFIEGLLNTGKYKFVSVAGAIKHENYTPVRTEEFGDDWIMFPVDGYGTKDTVRSLIRTTKPDILWFMTDPRFWIWLWEMENEIRPLVPMVYYHVWDNYPYPKFNKTYYESNDAVASISKVTDDIVRTVAPEVECYYIPHSVNTDIFIKAPEENIKQWKDMLLQNAGDRMVFFWNNRNARRKQSGSLIFWFKDFLDRVGHDKAMLLMHTDPKDTHGQDLEHIVRELDLTKGQVAFSKEKVEPGQLATVYNIADCTINIADAEGFGLSTMESLATGTPIIVSMTGGLQEQVTDGKEWFGIGIEPSSKAIIGSQDVPYIYEDRMNGKDVTDALEKFYNFSKEKRDAMGAKGREHIIKNYNFHDYIKNWDEAMTKVYEKHGSWENRKNYQGWELREL